jgi:hypothetical protein
MQCLSVETLYFDCVVCAFTGDTITVPDIATTKLVSFYEIGFGCTIDDESSRIHDGVNSIDDGL